MTETLLVSNVILWLVVLALCAVVVALVRQIGVLHERLAPAGALMLDQGPKVGEEAPQFELPTLGGETVTLGGPDSKNRSTLVFFLSPTCPVCKTLLPVLDAMRKSERDWLRIVLASDGDLPAQQSFVAANGLAVFPYVLSAELGLAYQVSKLPYGILIDEHGILRSKGLINSREHLESLFEAMERNVASVQDYLDKLQEKDVA
ncbi:MAG: methylamine dehydrogenase accessory protein MauD [Chromatiales bacterium]|jgi:methylamine dehydrogenase accessory protein MauD|nr:methylamine dehydrogenase accessory protein MauD [Chromatiales bacterium]MDP6151363.1 methylamine dehydrogenase accessory protein MauD [Gammaproteobacteria bacterium]MDP7093790.1 methylamine dehydrogenase accessory protein MauD [Gammaproteobacteria bacterium]MDP7271403.1 methylamine dehydrogenase accessory protein MauD [Gammaproteobacteria bacterium]HJP03938.1 methylamine dehydrogenase accessory protein MauD [Gammaproteobacteria bacterium]